MAGATWSKQRLSAREIEQIVEALPWEKLHGQDFGIELLRAFGKPKATLNQLRPSDAETSSPDHDHSRPHDSHPHASSFTGKAGRRNVAEYPFSEVALPKVLYFKPLEETRELSKEMLLDQVTILATCELTARYKFRFVVVSDYTHIAARDMLTGDTLFIEYADFKDHYRFFLPLAGMEKNHQIAETAADVKAAEYMGKLFDELRKGNPDLLSTEASRHAVNVFFMRLLFCFFAEDTGIFSPDQFTGTIKECTLEDGSDVHLLIADIFRSLDTPPSLADGRPKSEALSPLVRDFPYVNGKLFSREGLASRISSVSRNVPSSIDEAEWASTDSAASREGLGLEIPRFTRRARQHLIDLGQANEWADVNPDIFGSMFQAVVDPEQRANLGQHYTSVPNILKTIDPLFLGELRREVERADEMTDRGAITHLEKLLTRMERIKIADFACGSGNFLVIAYKCLRALEHQILRKLGELHGFHQGLLDSHIRLENFYGVEIDDFPAEVATLALWLAKHQMNMEFLDEFGVEIPLIPLRESATVVCANAARMNWEEFCPHSPDDEVYLISNPPYLGSTWQGKEQKEDFELYYGDKKYPKTLDYVALWVLKAGDYIHGSRAQFAFITTNSITQGSQVPLLFPPLFKRGLEIGYAYTSFKWENNATGNAGVTVIVLNMRDSAYYPKASHTLYTGDIAQAVSNINGYLIDAPNIAVEKRSKPSSPLLPPMNFGNKPTDGGHLLLDPAEMLRLIDTTPEAERFIRPIMGSAEFINGKDRFCLWITDEEAEEAQKIPVLARRIEAVREVRLASSDSGAHKLAATPWRFREQYGAGVTKLIVPAVSSERREYVPIGYLGPETIISNLAFTVYDAEPWLFALLTSRMHMAWLRTVGGKLKTDYRYSNTIVYNTFPVPTLSEHDKQTLTDTALRILDVREYYSECTLADLYDPEKMPDPLRLAHRENDAAVDRLYLREAGKPATASYAGDENRLAHLFALYSQQTTH